jgi:hypothetical protein
MIMSLGMAFLLCLAAFVLGAVCGVAFIYKAVAYRIEQNGGSYTFTR